MTDHRRRVTVVGGGLAGLTAAVYAARAGAAVTLHEARRTAGGRARTRAQDGFLFNQGPHALYAAGAARSILRDLRIDPPGRVPAMHGFHLDDGDRLRSALGPGGVGLGALRALIGGLRRDTPAGRSLAEHLAGLSPAALARVACLVRLTTYIDDLDDLDSRAAFAQARVAIRGVRYIDGGWETIVASLLGVARSAAVTINTEHRVTAVTADVSGRGFDVQLDDCAEYADAVVLAQGGPTQAAALLGGASKHLNAAAETSRPVTASCLDVALDPTAPQGAAVSLGINEPTYVIDHAATALLAPKGGHLIHAMWYGGDASTDRRPAVEAALDRSWPGWQAHVVEARWSRSLVVAHDRAHPGAPPVTHEVPDSPGLFVAGDWVTASGMLADAAVSSGRQAGRAAAGGAGLGDDHRPVRLGHPGSTASRGAR